MKVGRLAIGLWIVVAQSFGADAGAPDSSTASGYFGPVYDSMIRAPRPVAIYRSGGIPERMDRLELHWNPLGRLGVLLDLGSITTSGHPFFQEFGTNGRSCATCHQPPSGLSISLRNIKSRYNRTNGQDALFAPVDGANCPSAPPGRASHSLLLSRGVIRIPLPWPPRNADGSNKTVEFDLAVGASDDPAGCNLDATYGLAAGLVSVYRRPPSAGQINLKTTRFSDSERVLQGSLMWDGREETLEQQAINATLGHGQASAAPSVEQIAAIVAFQSHVFAAQLVDVEAGRLDARGAAGGPQRMTTILPFPAGGETFNEYTRWQGLGGERASIARGQMVFNRRTFNVSNVDGFNDRLEVGNPARFTTCSTCHNVANSGADSIANPQHNVGVGGTAAAFGGPRPAEDLPRFTLTCHASSASGFFGRGPIVTNDPGRALITGSCADIGKFTIPQLRALAAREPYFHDGSARRLEDVVDFYDRRFAIRFSQQERRDLINFLAAL